MEEIQKRASQEELINQIVARTQSSLNLETVMKTAVTEIGRMMRLSRIELRLDTSGDAESLIEDNTDSSDLSGESPPDEPDGHQPNLELEETG